jgi:hypothetical protein
MLHSFPAVLLTIHSFLVLSATARPWMGNGTAWSNSTGHVRARSFSVNSTFGTNVTVVHVQTPLVNLTNFYRIPAKRFVNVTSSINPSISMDKRYSSTNQSIYTNFTAHLTNTTSSETLVARVGKLFHVRRPLHHKNTSPWTNSTSYIEARRPANLTAFVAHAANITALSPKI